ncbi:MAG: hypothetical protein FJ280_12860 [Planctomycetes bacterium]|nr:hypothetical protein [Planctomycetota bacterium]
MMSKYRRSLWLLCLGAPALGVVCALCLAGSAVTAADNAVAAGRPPQIHPDWAGAVIPPNIAPLNFLVRESGSRYLVRLRSQHGRPLEIASRSGTIAIPLKAWRQLLDANRGGQLTFEVFVQDGKAWRRFDPLACTIAPEDIDNYLAYRRIHPVHAAWRDMGIYQRDLRRFDESTILTGAYFGDGCVNCHTFCNQRADTMLVSTRSRQYGNAATIVRDGTAEKVAATFGYGAWHPTGRILVYTSAKITMFQHPAGDEIRDVIDLDSLLAYYDVDSRTVKTTPALARKDRLETYPTWSPDGRFLYFCSAPLTWTERNVIPADYDRIRYDLVRIAYDAQRDAWGEPETILSARETGQSILLPRISPDGRWLLFTMCRYGCFPVYQQSSDLYLMDLQEKLEAASVKFEARAGTTGGEASDLTLPTSYFKLPINSDQSESWHSWSSNSRWIAFSSKRGNGTFTRTYLSYIDPNGVVHKPLLLPQQDPTHYDSCLWTYSVPELIAGPVPVTREKLGRVVRGARRIDVQLPITTATPKAGPETAGDPYRPTRE